MTIGVVLPATLSLPACRRAGAAPGFKSRVSGVVLLVLFGHWAALSWLQGQLQQLPHLAAMPDPVFTRVIEPQTPAEAAPRPRSAPQRPAAQAAVLRAALAPEPELPPVGAPEPAPEEAAPASGAAQQIALEAENPIAAPAAAVPTQAQAVDPRPDEAAPATAADGWPADTRLSYRLTGFYRGDLYGSARVQWQREQGRYQVRVDLSMALVIRVSMISQGELGEAGLLPRAYEEQVPTGLRRLAIDSGRVTLHDGSQLPQPPGVQDTASQFVELSHRFASGRETLEVGSQVSIWLARPFGVDLWTYDVLKLETLQTPEMGPVQAFHLRPRPIARPRGVIAAELWFAPSLQYLPVRVRIALGADNFVDLMVERIEQGAAPTLASPRAQDPP